MSKLYIYDIKETAKVILLSLLFGGFFWVETNQPTDEAAGGDFTNHNGTGAGQIRGGFEAGSNPRL